MWLYRIVALLSPAHVKLSVRSVSLTAPSWSISSNRDDAIQRILTYMARVSPMNDNCVIILLLGLGAGTDTAPYVAASVQAAPIVDYIRGRPAASSLSLAAEAHSSLVDRTA